MKIALLTANIGDIDNTIGLPIQKTPIDFYYYHSGNLPFPLPNLNARLQSKYVKICTHRFLFGYDGFLWHDGRVEVISKFYSQIMIENLNGYDIAIFPHKERHTIGEELQYILDNIKMGSHYLLTRYGNQQMEKELQFYKDNNAENLPLYHCNLFARKTGIDIHNPNDVDGCFNSWWMRSLEFTYFDQAMFSYCTQHLKINVLDLKYRDGLCKIHKHK